MTYQLESEVTGKPATIEEAFPELDGRRTTSLIAFVCPDCKERNSSNVFLDGDVPSVVCGACFNRIVPVDSL